MSGVRGKGEMALWEDAVRTFTRPAGWTTISQTMPSTTLTKARPVADQEHRPRQLKKVRVEYKDDARFVTCFCGTKVTRSIVPHLKKKHSRLWKTWIHKFIELRGDGLPLKRIMRVFRAGSGQLLFSWTVVEREIRKVVESGEAEYVPPPVTKVSRWKPKDFQLEKTTLWDFPRRGDWAVHRGDYRGNWPPEIPRNLILKYTDPGDVVVDSFVGGGTTLIEAWLLGRKSVGLDVSRMAIQTCNTRLAEMRRLAKKDPRASLDEGITPKIVHGDALSASKILPQHGVEAGSVALWCAHPPYLDSLRYTGGNGADLSGVGDPDLFVAKMRVFAGEVSSMLAPDGVLAVLIGDVPKRGKTIFLGKRTLDCLLEEGFELNDVIIKSQHRDRSSEFYFGKKRPGLLMAHEYLFVMSPNTRR